MTSKKKDNILLANNSQPKIPLKSIIARVNAASATVLATGCEKVENLQRHSSIIDLGIKVKDVSKSLKIAAEDELLYEAQNFADSTTAHGIPLVC